MPLLVKNDFHIFHNVDKIYILSLVNDDTNNKNNETPDVNEFKEKVKNTCLMITAKEKNWQMWITLISKSKMTNIKTFIMPKEEIINPYKLLHCKNKNRKVINVLWFRRIVTWFQNILIHISKIVL